MIRGAGFDGRGRESWGLGVEQKGEESEVLCLPVHVPLTLLSGTRGPSTKPFDAVPEIWTVPEVPDLPFRALLRDCHLAMARLGHGNDAGVMLP